MDFVDHDVYKLCNIAEGTIKITESVSEATIGLAQRLESCEQSNEALRRDNAVLRGLFPMKPPGTPRHRGPRYERAASHDETEEVPCDNA